MNAQQNQQDRKAQEKPEILTSELIGGGQDKYRIVGAIKGKAYEVGPYDTDTRAAEQARKLAAVSDEAPKILPILTCSSVDSIVRKYREIADEREKARREAEAKQAENDKAQAQANGKPAEEGKSEEPKSGQQAEHAARR